MKTTFFSFLMAASAILFSACNNSTNETSKSATETTGADSSKSTTANSAGSKQAATEKPVMANVDPKVSSSINAVVDHYLHVKNGLASDNGAEAASGAKALMETMSKVDQSALPADQKKVYADVADDLKEMAEHISESAGKIDHQREHFVMMSDDVYELVKNFGYSKPLFLDHCPMANENKGANWVSEQEAIANPYTGKKMPTCGTVEKVIKQ